MRLVTRDGDAIPDGVDFVTCVQIVSIKETGNPCDAAEPPPLTLQAAEGIVLTAWSDSTFDGALEHLQRIGQRKAVVSLNDLSDDQKISRTHSSDSTKDERRGSSAGENIAVCLAEKPDASFGFITVPSIAKASQVIAAAMQRCPVEMRKERSVGFVYQGRLVSLDDDSDLDLFRSSGCRRIDLIKENPIVETFSQTVAPKNVTSTVAPPSSPPTFAPRAASILMGFNPPVFHLVGCERTCEGLASHLERGLSSVAEPLTSRMRTRRPPYFDVSSDRRCRTMEFPGIFFDEATQMASLLCVLDGIEAVSRSGSLGEPLKIHIAPARVSADKTMHEDALDQRTIRINSTATKPLNLTTPKQVRIWFEVAVR